MPVARATLIRGALAVADDVDTLHDLLGVATALASVDLVSTWP